MDCEGLVYTQAPHSNYSSQGRTDQDSFCSVVEETSRLRINLYLDSKMLPFVAVMLGVVVFEATLMMTTSLCADPEARKTGQKCTYHHKKICSHGQRIDFIRAKDEKKAIDY